MLSVPKVRISGSMRKRLTSVPCDHADGGAQRHHRREHRQQQLGAAVGEGAAQHHGKAEQLADREIDQPAGDDEGLADRHQAERGRLGDDVRQVGRRREARNEQQRGDEHDREQPVDAGAVRQRLHRGDRRGRGRHQPSWRITVSLSSTQPNLLAKFFSVAACRSGANDDTASFTSVVRKP